MKHFLVKEDSNYADEFDLQGFKLFEAESEEDLKSTILLRVLDGGEFPLDKYFGTNEVIEIEDEEALWNMLDITEISKTDYDILLKLFRFINKSPFGLTGIL
jgi:hypothetical protein